jgi:hypothetical protein
MASVRLTRLQNSITIARDEGGLGGTNESGSIGLYFASGVVDIAKEGKDHVNIPRHVLVPDPWSISASIQVACNYRAVPPFSTNPSVFFAGVK